MGEDAMTLVCDNRNLRLEVTRLQDQLSKRSKAETSVPTISGVFSVNDRAMMPASSAPVSAPASRTVNAAPATVSVNTSIAVCSSAAPTPTRDAPLASGTVGAAPKPAGPLASGTDAPVPNGAAAAPASGTVTAVPKGVAAGTPPPAGAAVDTATTATLKIATAAARPVSGTVIAAPEAVTVDTPLTAGATVVNVTAASPPTVTVPAAPAVTVAVATATITTPARVALSTIDGNSAIKRVASGKSASVSMRATCSSNLKRLSGKGSTTQSANTPLLSAACQRTEKATVLGARPCGTATLRDKKASQGVAGTGYSGNVRKSCGRAKEVAQPSGRVLRSASFIVAAKQAAVKQTQTPCRALDVCANSAKSALPAQPTG